MHPKNSFNLRLLFRVTSGLFLLVGPCVAYNVYDAGALNAQLVAEGVEVVGIVHDLEDVSGTGGVQYSKGRDKCAFRARFRATDGEEFECREVFNYACPPLDVVKESPLTYVPSEPKRCRILSKVAVAADGDHSHSLTRMLWIIGLAVLALLASFIVPKAKQSEEEAQVEG